MGDVTVAMSIFYIQSKATPCWWSVGGASILQSYDSKLNREINNYHQAFISAQCPRPHHWFTVAFKYTCRALDVAFKYTCRALDGQFPVRVFSSELQPPRHPTRGPLPSAALRDEFTLTYSHQFSFYAA